MVLTLTGIMCGFSTLFFSRALPGARLNGAARDISSVIRHARALTRLKHEDQTVTVDGKDRRYGIKGRPPRFVPEGVTLETVDPVPGRASQDERTFRFYATGGQEAGSVIVRNKDKSLRIDTDPVAGSVTIKTAGR